MQNKYWHLAGLAVIYLTMFMLTKLVSNLKNDNVKPQVNNITVVDLAWKYTNIVIGSHTWTIRSNGISVELENGNSILIPVSENYKITIH